MESHTEQRWGFLLTVTGNNVYGCMYGLRQNSERRLLRQGIQKYYIYILYHKKYHLSRVDYNLINYNNMAIWGRIADQVNRLSGHFWAVEAKLSASNLPGAASTVSEKEAYTVWGATQASPIGDVSRKCSTSLTLPLPLIPHRPRRRGEGLKGS